jgi:hypothetical protein
LPDRGEERLRIDLVQHRMRVGPKRSLLVVFLLTLAVLGGNRVISETAQQQLNEIVRDTQRQGNRAGRVTLVWWLIPEFWRAAMAASATVPVDKIDEMVTSIRDINVFVIVDAKIGASGTADFASSDELQKTLSVIDTLGKPVGLIPSEKQSAATKNMLAIMKPVMTNMLGEFGKNLTFFVFEGKNQNGSRRIDPAKPGSLIVKLNAEEFRWRLPLGSLLSRKICPKCNETFPGNYAFCPFDATPLNEKAEEKN